MTKDMTHPVTRGELDEALEALDKAFDRRLAPFATKQELNGAVEAIMAALGHQEARIKADIVNVLSAEIAHHTSALGESLRADMKAMMEPHEDHPRRIANLEVAVFGPAKPRRKRRPQG